MIDAVSTAPIERKPAVIPTIGQGVWYYAEHVRTQGMKSHDWDVPFAAFITYVWNDRLANLAVTDHDGNRFAFSKVPVFHGDDLDDQTAAAHCALEAPAPREAATVSGVEGEPIALGLDATAAELGNNSSGVASVKMIFTVPPGDSYRFTSESAGLDLVFASDPKPQTLVLTKAEITAGALGDLMLTATLDGESSLTVTVVEQPVSGTVGRTYTFTEIVTVAVAPPEAEEAQPIDSAAIEPYTPAPAPAPMQGATAA